MRIALIALSLFTILSACAGGSNTPPPTPYVALPLADLAPNTELVVRGNHTGWWRDRTTPVGVNSPNENGQKLQRLDTTANANEYVAVFRNNNTNVYYGKGTFIMPANGVTYNGTTDLGYKFSITRSNDNLIYTLTGVFTMANQPTVSSNRWAYGGFTAGSYTPAADMPTTGSATYTGTFLGYSSISGLVTGNASISVNFAAATSQITGTVTGITGGINDLTIQATLDGAGQGMPGASFDVGSIVTAGPSNGAGSFAQGTTGSVEGGFYGPNAEEIGITIRLSSAPNFLTGSIGGSRP